MSFEKKPNAYLEKRDSISWNCRNDTGKQNCKLNIHGFLLQLVTLESKKQRFGQYLKITSQSFVATF